MNKVTLLGILTNDVILKTSITNKKYSYFTVAVASYQQKVNYINCVAWDQLAEKISVSVNKGSQVLVSGYLTTRKDNSTNKTIMEVVSNNVTVLDCKKEHISHTTDLNPITNTSHNGQNITVGTPMSQQEIAAIITQFDKQ